ncbi:S-layer homology domain-containing protein [Paenibacillus alkaliterrae]|uniref:S-layer homology domain-containing protein n=1 Tax=Paenibacillus alkaliterrae TaxID=320909 RepID=UPI001F20CF82|nr:alpha-amylase family glycosyl hydrolase [Paenibacillus alkaliterrae]MCF2941557.1 S-layer homology domain-containing protein [Paenibacillus alkaliterrae]
MPLFNRRNKARISLIVSAFILLQLFLSAFVPLTAEAAAGGSSISTTVTGDVIADEFVDQPGGANEWYIAGSFQGWNNTASPFAHLVGEFYAYSIVLDAGTHEFKFTKNGTWDGLSNGGNNFSLTLAERTKVNFYINDEINQARINVAGVEGLSQYMPVLTADKWPRLVGSIQSVFSEPEWSPSDARQLFVDYNFNNTVYKLQRNIPTGQYEAKVAFGSNWDESYGYNAEGHNLPVAILDPANVTFTIDYSATPKVLSNDYKPADGNFDGMINVDAIRFDSRSITYKKPFGAIPEGRQDLTLRIAAKKDDVQVAKAELINEESLAKTYDMRKVTSVGDLDYFEAIIPSADFHGIGVWGYKFILVDGPAKVEYGDDGVRGGTGKALDEGAVPFDLTVYDADFQTPDWMKNAIVYQIYPDRFFDGYEGNNRAKTVDGYRGDRSEDRAGAPINPFPLQYFDGGVENEPTPDQVWGEWSDIPEMPERLTPENAPYYSGSKTDGIWTNEFYGGDIQGVQAKLNYLESIGVTAIYFNPIAWAGSNHKYDATDYNHLDPMFGEPVYNTPGDPKSGLNYDATRKASDAVFIEFANEARTRGIHIIADGVFNHVGDDSIYFDRYEKFPEIGAYEYWAKVWDHVNDDAMTQADAEQTVIDAFTGQLNPATGVNYKYPEDFEFTTWFTVHNEKVLSRDHVYMYKYDAWWGYDSLPTMDAIEPIEGDADALPGRHEWNVPSYRNHVIGYDLTEMTPEEQQTAMQNTASQVWNWMGASGWRLDVAPDVSFGTWEKFRTAVKSQTGLTNANGQPIPDPIILGEEWGVATHYLLGNQFDSVMNYRFRAALQSFLTGGNAQTMHSALESIREDYPKEAWLAMLNLVGSHDTTRNITKMDYPQYEENRVGIAPDATETARKLQQLTAIFQMGYPGAPTVYYGDEVGLEGTKDPDSRRTFPWERVSEAEGQFMGAGKYASVFNVYKKSAEIRNNNKVFRTGDIKVAYAQGDVIAYARKNSAKAGLVVINKGVTEATIEADVAGFIPNGVIFSDQLYGTAQSTVDGGKLALTIPALTGFMMVNEGELAEVPVVPNAVAAGDNGFVSLSWDAVAGAEGYNVYRAPIEGGELTLLSDYQAGLTFADNTVTNGVKYYYAVTAAIGNGESAILDMVSATPAFPINSVTIMGQAEDMTIGAGNSTSEITIAIEVNGLTDAAANAGIEAPNMIARLAYYADGTDKANAADTRLRYKEDVDGSKVYYAAFEPTEAGVFRYFAKVSANNGESYTESAEATFNANADTADTTAPLVPVLEDITVESNLASLVWTAEGEDISGFDIFRKKLSDPGFTKIATLANTVTNYVDYSVSNDIQYIYKIAAFDQSYNRSYSAEKSVMPRLVMVDVTLRLHLPAYTPAQDGIYIAGNFNGWNSSGNELKVPSGATSRDVVEYTFKMMAGKSIEYKYTRGTWETEAFTSHTRIANDTEDLGNWAYSSTDTNMKLTIKNEGGNKMMVEDYVLRWVDMPMMVSMPRISYGEDIEYTAAGDENRFTVKANVPYGVEFTINDVPIADSEMDQYGNVWVQNIPLEPGTNTFVLHIAPTEETLAEPWYTDKGRAGQATKTINLTVYKAEGNDDGGSTPTKPAIPIDPKAEAVNPKANPDGKVPVTLPNGKNKVLLPANAEAINKNNKVEVKNDKFEAVISGEVLEDLKSLLNETELKEANISFEANRVSTDEAEQLVNKEKAKAKLKMAGEVFEFKLVIVDKNGKEMKLTKFDPPIEMTLHVSDTANKDLLGMYYIADDGSLEYVGGELIGSKITASIRHFSKYAVLEYDKSFKDVSEQYWAYDVIKKMAAKHIAKGVSDTEFAPMKPVTRAEFTALIVRALGLEATKEASFKDVDGSRWYAEAAAAAYEAGIVSGRSNDTFAPNDTITREEMAVMIVKAYEVKAGKQATASIEAEFADRTGVSVWAQAAVHAAAELGFIQGRNNNRFVPQGQTNRAESAQVISKLLDSIN